MRTIKTDPMFWTSNYLGDDVFSVMCELEHDINCIVKTFNNREDEARNLTVRLNAAAYRWAISKNE